MIDIFGLDIELPYGAKPVKSSASVKRFKNLKKPQKALSEIEEPGRQRIVIDLNEEPKVKSGEDSQAKSI